MFVFLQVLKLVVEITVKAKENLRMEVSFPALFGKKPKRFVLTGVVNVNQHTYFTISGFTHLMFQLFVFRKS